MEKEYFALAKFKEGEGNFEKFMGFMQSEEGMEARRKFAIPEKTIGGVAPDKSAVMFKVFVTDLDGMKEFVRGDNPVGRSVFQECIESTSMWELTPVDLK